MAAESGVAVGFLEVAFLVSVAIAGAALGWSGHRWLGFESHAAALASTSTRILAALVSAAAVIACVLRFGLTVDALAYAVFALVGVQLSVIDLRYRLLPNLIVLPTAVTGAILLAVSAAVGDNWDGLLRAVLGAVVLFVAYFLLAVISPSGLGMGDVKLAISVGLFLGYQSWPAVLLGTLAAFILAAVVAIAVMVSGRGNRHTAIPFGPFMLIGAGIAILAGDALTGLILPSL